MKTKCKSLIRGRLHSFTATSAMAGSLALFLCACERCESQANTYTIGTLGSWNGVNEISGFGIGSYTDVTIGQTFNINNGNATVTSITIPVFGYAPKYASAASEFQVGVAAWNGSEATGSVLYLSGTETASGSDWQTFTVAPTGLTLLSGQEYILFLTPNNFTFYDNGSEADVGDVSSGSYTGGHIYTLAGFEDNVDSLFSSGWTGVGSDMAFSLTYQTVPEPTILALASLGSVSLLLFRRLRKQAA